MFDKVLCNKFWESSIIFTLHFSGWFRRVIFYLWLLESSSSVQEIENWSSWSDTYNSSPGGSEWNCYFVDCLCTSVRPSFDQFLPISGGDWPWPPPRAKSSPFVWVKVRRILRRARGKKCGIFLVSLKTGRRGWCRPLSLWLPAARRWDHTERLTNGLRSTDNLILWHIINYDNLSISIMLITFLISGKEISEKSSK